MSMRTTIKTALFSGLLSAAGLVGCHSEHRAPPPPPPRAVVVEPGYYYDREYYDDDRHFHPRQVYYYDGHHYEPHDAPPPNVVIHERAVHVDRGELHEGDRRPPGEELHGGDFNHDDHAGQLPPRDR